MANTWNLWIVYALMQFLTFDTALGDCSPVFGPVGPAKCIKAPDYDKYQWATCLTNNYIQTKSKGRHVCVTESATYCYYQCMIEMYNKETGVVNSVCACGPDAADPSAPNTPPVPLPSECLSPTGTDCTWYMECLEKRYPCSKQGQSYAVDFAEKFCNLYQRNRNKFSSKGQIWIDAVRKCLQVALAPLLRPYVSTTCAQIQKTAFASHSPCYLRPDNAANNSICDLGVTDWLQVFWTIRESFIDVPQESMLGVWDVTQGCTPSIIESLWKWMKHVIFRVEVAKPSGIERRSTDFDQEAVAKQIIADVSGKMQWQTKGVSWFGYAGEASATSTNVHILLTDRKSHDADALSSTPSVDLNKTITDLADAANGTFIFNIGSNLKVKTLYGCEDLKCTKLTFEETVVEAEKSSGVATATYAVLLTILMPSIAMTFFI